LYNRRETSPRELRHEQIDDIAEIGKTQTPRLLRKAYIAQGRILITSGTLCVPSANSDEVFRARDIEI
jgi:hypothetical protein